jgi:DivIVA domain-containing protein
MDWKNIDRLRDPGFTVARRGYDQREVDRFLSSLVEWLETDAATDLGELVVKRKLEHVGKSTGRILLAAEEESTKLRRLTQEECTTMRSDAEAVSDKTRKAADEYAKGVRAKADEEARKTEEAARARATRLVEDGERRRAQIDATVAELEGRRDDTIQQLNRLRTELSSTLGTHEPAAPAPKRDAKPQTDAPHKAKESGAVAKA